MLAYSSLLLSLTAGCTDKGSDSAGDESDADTDTDSDTDTDTDVEPQRHLEGTVHVTVTDATGKKTLCDTMVDITGEEFAGGCLQCDFTLDVETTVASEAGTDCDYSAYPVAHLLEDAFWDDVYLGWSDAFTGYYRSYADLLWLGFTAYGTGPSWQNVVAYADGVNGTTSYDGGQLGWTRAYNLYGYNGTQLYLCYYPLYTPGSPNYGGAYTGSGSLDCSYVTPYENWTFQGVDNGYAYISVDTVSKDTTFDPLFYVSSSSSDSCVTGFGNESFECAFAPTGGLCPSLALPTETGETYTVSVRPVSPCDGATGDYEILVDTNGDPSLKRVAGGELTPYLGHVSAEGDTTITLK